MSVIGYSHPGTARFPGANAMPYYSAELMPEKIWLILVPIPGSKVAIATTVAAAIRPYSIAVTPSLFFNNMSIFWIILWNTATTLNF